MCFDYEFQLKTNIHNYLIHMQSYSWLLIQSKWLEMDYTTSNCNMLAERWGLLRWLQLTVRWQVKIQTLIQIHSKRSLQTILQLLVLNLYVSQYLGIVQR